MASIVDHVKTLFTRKAQAIVLMYHRVTEPDSDVWELAVSPDRFEQQLRILKKMGSVVPLQQLSENINLNRYRKSIAITFDDGYIDNFTNAKPLLEKYNIPATFFITTGQIDSHKEFWWDELERIFLLKPNLPPTFSMVFNNNTVVFELQDEIYLSEEYLRKHRLWKACSEAPPTKRAKLFYDVWEQLKPLPFTEQAEYLNMIRKWADAPSFMRAEYRTMSAVELKQLAAHHLFTIGAHTVTHPALAYHSIDFQRNELNENRKFLQELTGQEINMLAYPYGNHNEDSIRIAKECGFVAAFTTVERSLKPGSNAYHQGRFQVKNLTGTAFRDQFKKWRY